MRLGLTLLRAKTDLLSLLLARLMAETREKPGLDPFMAVNRRNYHSKSF